MKTVKEMYDEIMASEDLEKEISAAKDMEAVELFLKKHGCDEPAEKFLTCAKLNSMSEEDGELNDEEAAAVAGGKRWVAFIFDNGNWFDHTSPWGMYTSRQYFEYCGYCDQIQQAIDDGNMALAKKQFDFVVNQLENHCTVGYVWQVKGCWPELVDYKG